MESEEKLHLCFSLVFIALFWETFEIRFVLVIIRICLKILYFSSCIELPKREWVSAWGWTWYFKNFQSHDKGKTLFAFNVRITFALWFQDEFHWDDLTKVSNPALPSHYKDTSQPAVALLKALGVPRSMIIPRYTAPKAENNDWAIWSGAVKRNV